MITYLTISCITLCFCVIAYLWVRQKRKKDWEVPNHLTRVTNPMVPGPLVEDYRGRAVPRQQHRREWGFDGYPYGHLNNCRCESCRVTSQHYVNIRLFGWDGNIETDIPPTRQGILDILQHRNTIHNRDYFIPLREKKEDFLPKKKIKSHKLVKRKYTIRRPGIYTREVDYSVIVTNIDRVNE